MHDHRIYDSPSNAWSRKNGGTDITRARAILCSIIEHEIANYYPAAASSIIFLSSSAAARAATRKFFPGKNCPPERISPIALIYRSRGGADPVRGKREKSGKRASERKRRGSAGREREVCLPLHLFPRAVLPLRASALSPLARVRFFSSSAGSARDRSLL